MSKHDTTTGVYIRVSTDDKQEKGLESQEHAIRKYLKGHGIANAKWYRDRVSGAKIGPARKKMEEDIFYGRIRTVIVWDLDRITRKGMADGLTIMGKWLEQGVRLVSLNQQFDFTGPMGEIIAGVFFWCARQLRENLIKATKRGLESARAKGVVLGRPRKLKASDIVALLDKGLSYEKVGVELSSTRQALYNTLKREGIIYKRNAS